MADSIDALILTALTRAAAAPEGMPLYASKTALGLFPATASGRTAGKRATEEGLFSIVREGKPPREIAHVRPHGFDRLIAESNPKAVLDDFVRVLESREMQVNAMIVAAREMTEQLAALKRIVAAMLPKVTTAKLPESSRLESFVTRPRLNEIILARLEDWTASASEDCPLPVLFRDLVGPTTVGEFHDCLRTLHTNGEIYLHPWTGPLYALPEPSLSLLVGHEVAYYASLQTKEISPQRALRTQSV